MVFVFPVPIKTLSAIGTLISSFVLGFREDEEKLGFLVVNNAERETVDEE